MAISACRCSLVQGEPLDVEEVKLLLYVLVVLLADQRTSMALARGRRLVFDGKLDRSDFHPRRTMPNHEPKAPSPGGHGFALPRMRCVGLPATRTRTASKHALSRPFVPERRIAEGHVVRSSVISAGFDTLSGSRLASGTPWSRLDRQQFHVGRIH